MCVEREGAEKSVSVPVLALHSVILESSVPIKEQLSAEDKLRFLNW